MMIQNDSCFWDGLKSPMGYIEVLVSFFVGSVSWFGVFQSHFSSALYTHLSACSFALKALIQTLSTACPDLLAGDGQWLHLFQPICLGSPGAADALLLTAARDGQLAAAAAVWAAAFQKPCLARVLLRLSGEVRLSPSLRRFVRVLYEQSPNEDDFFEDLLDGRLPRVIFHLAQGVNVEATGPAIHRNDVGCCKWTPLAAAADIAARRTQGLVISNVLLAARADVNRPCPGPCGWTPLMRAALSGAPAESTLKLLVQAGADVRMRHEKLDGAFACFLSKVPICSNPCPSFHFLSV